MSNFVDLWVKKNKDTDHWLTAYPTDTNVEADRMNLFDQWEGNTCRFPWYIYIILYICVCVCVCVCVLRNPQFTLLALGNKPVIHMSGLYP